MRAEPSSQHPSLSLGMVSLICYGVCGLGGRLCWYLDTSPLPGAILGPSRCAPWLPVTALVVHVTHPPIGPNLSWRVRST
jgi:hypothetical protein